MCAFRREVRNLNLTDGSPTRQSYVLRGVQEDKNYHTSYREIPFPGSFIPFANVLTEEAPMKKLHTLYLDVIHF